MIRSSNVRLRLLGGAVRVAVIGAGAAGLTAAWLLQDDHEVTLFEKEPRLGGHAHTVAVPHHGDIIQVELGFEFFVEEGYPAFSRLLQALRVTLRRYPMTFTLYIESSGAVYLLPPKRPDHFFWPAFAPRTLADLLQFDFLLRRGARLVERRDTAVSIDDFVTRLPFSSSFRAEFLYPLMIGGWCFPLEEFQRMSAYNILKYFVLFRPDGLGPRAVSEIEGGTAAYIAALRDAMPRVAVHCRAKIQSIRRHAGGFAVMDAAGDAREFDHIVFATNAAEAHRLLHDVDGAEEERAVLGRFRYFRTAIAVHGDRRLMPPEEKHWSVFNVRWSKGRGFSTVWKQQRTSAPVFRSWLAPGEPLPEPLYDLSHYDHPAMDLEHYRAQHALTALQGRRNLWFAGLYTYDVDSHESAVQSAIHVARQLAPASRNLALLV